MNFFESDRRATARGRRKAATFFNASSSTRRLWDLARVHHRPGGQRQHNTSIVLILATSLLTVGCTREASNKASALVFEQVAQAYTHPSFDPDESAWREVHDHGAFETLEIYVVELAKLRPGEGAKKQYDAYLNAILPGIESVGGKVVKVNDILTPGVGDVEDFNCAGGTASIVHYPSRADYMTALLTDEYQAASQLRHEALADVLSFVTGPNVIPMEARFNLNQTGKLASEIPTPNVDGKSPEQLVEELLAFYPDGGGDPTRGQLETETTYQGFRTEPIYFFNLYDFGAGAEAVENGTAHHQAYFQGAVPYTRARGARPFIRAQVQHNLLGEIDWDVFILVGWPSLSMVIDLRLDPGYQEVQKHRVQIGEHSGNFVAIDRESPAH